jgi:hypothetical protein
MYNLHDKVNHWYWDGEPGLIRLVEENQSEGMIVVEIGCYDGSTTRKYIDIVKKNNGHVIVIDTFMGSEFDDTLLQFNSDFPNNAHAYGKHNNDLYDVFLEKFANYKDMMTVHRGRSTDYIPLLPENCNIIFIDADHRYHAVKTDIELSLNKVMKGGIICGHDLSTFDYVNTYTSDQLKADTYNGHHPGVSQAVYEKFGKTETYGVVWFSRVD